jgi:hypothetical protein
MSHPVIIPFPGTSRAAPATAVARFPAPTPSRSLNHRLRLLDEVFDDEPKAAPPQMAGTEYAEARLREAVKVHAFAHSHDLLATVKLLNDLTQEVLRRDMTEQGFV